MIHDNLAFTPKKEKRMKHDNKKKKKKLKTFMMRRQCKIDPKVANPSFSHFTNMLTLENSNPSPITRNLTNLARHDGGP